jgi:phosphohistidine phosphatase SixA
MHNVENFNCEDDTKRPSHLTEKGKEEVQKSATKIKSKKIDVDFVSPLIRTQETSKIVKEYLDSEIKAV